MKERRVRLAVLLSGSGRTLVNFLEKIDAGELPVEIVGVVSSRGDVRGVEVAREAGLPVTVIRKRDHADVAAHNAAIAAWLEPLRPEIIALAGYLCYFIRPGWYDGPVVNIHPALLPRHGGRGMYGDRVHAAVLAAGDSESGCTGHHVKRGQVYEIPYRCLLAPGLRNLATVGRTIGSAGDAWQVTRVIAPAVMTGQAAGTAAALAIEGDIDLHLVPVPELQARLAATGVIIHQPAE